MATTSEIFGKVSPPSTGKYFTAGTSGEGLFLFLSNIFKLVGTIAGIYMVVQFMVAGYMYMNAGGDPKKTEAAWTKIWQSMLGLVIISSAFVIAAVVERFTGIKILNPTISGPNQ